MYTYNMLTIHLITCSQRGRFEKLSVLKIKYQVRLQKQRENTNSNSLTLVFFPYRVIRIVLNGVLNLSVWSIINVNSTIVPREA